MRQKLSVNPKTHLRWGATCSEFERHSEGWPGRETAECAPAPASRCECVLLSLPSERSPLSLKPARWVTDAHDLLGQLGTAHLGQTFFLLHFFMSKIPSTAPCKKYPHRFKFSVTLQSQTVLPFMLTRQTTDAKQLELSPVGWTNVWKPTFMSHHRIYVWALTGLF